MIDATVEGLPGLVNLKGTVVGTSPASGVIAYNADASISRDYHATADVVELGADGRFSVDIPSTGPGTYWLELRTYGPAGMFKLDHLTYAVDQQNVPGMFRLTVKSEPS